MTIYQNMTILPKTRRQSRSADRGALLSEWKWNTKFLLGLDGVGRALRSEFLRKNVPLRYHQGPKPNQNGDPNVIGRYGRTYSKVPSNPLLDV